ncbi:MAG: D-alanyl-D-alanine carboxypeptidase/D-alanyl-D-alanine-endopeptidase [Bacteroidetes bacterium]|nr:D-alanyl-D-alanine carboxypeptidase/D-alanyl-D-alanine-endopeptidase [Bacteroidota bacterium]
MKLHYIIPVLTFVFIGCASGRLASKPLDSSHKPEQIPDMPLPVEQLKHNIDSLLSDTLFIPSNVCIKVVSLDKNDTLYERNSSLLMNPGSNIKLITSAAALSVLDTNCQFKTTVSFESVPVNGILKGNVYLKGYGNPVLTSSDIECFADAVRTRGVNEIKGNIVVDDSFFDDKYWGAGWVWDDESDSDAPQINPLSVNNNCVRISLLGDLDAVYPFTEPKTNFVKIINDAKLTADSVRVPLKIKRSCYGNENTILIEGEVLKSKRPSMKIPVCSPEYYTGTLFKESLERAGVIVRGRVAEGCLPPGAREIVLHSQPIAGIITNMNKISDNLSAENLLKTMGAVKYGVPGSAEKGILAVNRFLSDLNMDTSKFSIVDGSGVSRYNLLSADQIVQFLSAMYNQHKLFPIFYNSLPVAGNDGTLTRRMNSYPAANNLHAKTGTLNGVSCLSGYVISRDGEMLAFSILMQNFISPLSCYTMIQDKIAGLLAEFSRILALPENNDSIIFKQPGAP